MRPEEEKLRGVLEGVEGELSRPGGLGRTDGRVGELWGKVNRAKVVYGSGSAQGRREDGWAVVDDNGMKELAKLLEEQQRGLEHVTSVLQKAIKDLGVLETHLGGNSSSTGVSPSKGYGVGRR
jgi:nuclear pore complex protein Nup54